MTITKKSFLYFLKDIVRRIHRMWVSPRRYDQIFKAIDDIQPRRLLEVGTWTGDRALQMIQTAQKHCQIGQVEYYGLDLFDEMTSDSFQYELSKRPPSKQEVEEKLATTGATVRLIQGDTTKFPNDVWESLPDMDFIFIDGGHSLETVRSDWEHVRKLMHDITVVVFDDYWRNRTDAGAKPIVDAIDTNKYCVEILPEVDCFDNQNFGRLEIQLAKVKKRKS